MADQEAEAWKGEEELERKHPVAVLTHDLAVRISKDIKKAEWLKESDQQEHPLREVRDGVMIAAAKLAGALNMFSDEEEIWPPDEIHAGGVLVRLKKARECLKDTLAGLEDCEEQNLATPEWRSSIRAGVMKILREVERLIVEVRG